MKNLVTAALLILFISGCETDEAQLQELAQQFIDERNQNGEETLTETPQIWDKEITCSADLEEVNKCILEGKERIVDYAISSESSPECFEKGAVRVAVGGKRVRVKNGCDLVLNIKTSLIEKVELKEDDLFSNVKGFASGSISLPDSLVTGEQVTVLENEEEVVLTNTIDGVGIAGGVHAPDQLNFDPVTGEFEALSFALPENSVKVRITVSRMFARESTGERGLVLLLDGEGKIVRKRVVRWGKRGVENNLNVKSVALRTKGAKVAIVLPIDYKNNDEAGRTDSSDFFLKSVKFFNAAE